jgi:hypothetical protein
MVEPHYGTRRETCNPKCVRAAQRKWNNPTAQRPAHLNGEGAARSVALQPHARMDTDHNLLFGVLALQADLIDTNRFAEACSARAARKDTPLASLLVERGWLTPADRDGVEQFLERKLKKHGGDVRASLAEVVSDPVRQTLTKVADPEVRRTLNAAPRPADGLDENLTVNYQPVGRGRYTLNRQYARGGFGQVWVAHDGDLGREVALKELLAGGAENPVVVARFIIEAYCREKHNEPPSFVEGLKNKTHFSLDKFAVVRVLFS